MPPATYGQHRRFCELDEWVSRDTNHTHYTILLPDGRFLRTKVSHGAASKQYGAKLWSRVLKQLDVTEEEFYEVLKSRNPVRRGATPATTPKEPPRGPRIPLWLHQLLTEKVGMSQEEVGELTEEEARARWIEWQSAPKPTDE